MFSGMSSFGSHPHIDELKQHLRGKRRMTGGSYWTDYASNIPHPTISSIPVPMSYGGAIINGYEDPYSFALLQGQGVKRRRQRRSNRRMDGGKLPSWLTKTYNTVVAPVKAVENAIVPYASQMTQTPSSKGADAMLSGDGSNWFSGSGVHRRRMRRSNVRSHLTGGKHVRGEIVRRVMQEHGLSLPHASRFVKEHGLY